MASFHNWLVEEILSEALPGDRPPLVRKAEYGKVGNWISAITEALAWIRKKLFYPGNVIPQVVADEGVAADERLRPSDRLRQTDSLWGSENHGLHEWLLGHGCPGYARCDGCHQGGHPGLIEYADQLGQGQYGKAYQTGDKVLKVTTDAGEAAISDKVKGRQGVLVIDVRRLSRYRTTLGPVFAILQHFGSRRGDDLPPALLKAAEYLRGYLFAKRDFSSVSQDFVARSKESNVDAVSRFSRTTFSPEVKMWMEVIIDIVMGVYGLSGAVWYDPHGENLVMVGDEVLPIDLGNYVMASGRKPLDHRKIQAV